MILSELAPLVSAQHGVFYSMTSALDGGEPRARAAGRLRLRGAQAPLDVLPARRGPGRPVREGEEADPAHRRSRPTTSGSTPGSAQSTPLNIIVLPVLFEGSVRAVVELASFSPFSVTHQAFLDSLTESIGLVLNTIEADTLTENLLKQSQSLAEELRAQQEELRESNEDLGRQAALLAEQNIEAEQQEPARSRSRSASSRRRPASSPSPRSTSRSSSRTCRTSCARR